MPEHLVAERTAASRKIAARVDLLSASSPDGTVFTASLARPPRYAKGQTSQRSAVDRREPRPTVYVQYKRIPRELRALRLFDRVGTGAP
jgi:hypothetical protein